MTKWLRRLAYLVFRTREERDLDEEMRHHVDLEAAELVSRGMDPLEARRRARIVFGGVDRYREEVRGARGVLWMDQVRQDLGFAMRTLRRSPGFAAGALIVLALGIGATTTAFGVANAVLLRPLPYPEPDQLVRVWPAAPELGQDRRTFSVPDFRDWRDRTTTLSPLALYSTLPGPLVLTGRGPAEEIPTAWVAGDFFGVFRVEAQVGRTLRLDEDGEGLNRVMVVSHGYWQRRFGGDPSIVGQTLMIGQEPFQLVGVMPPDFAYPSAEIDAWVFVSIVAQTSIPTERRYVRFMSAVGRMAPGVSVGRADQDLDAIAAALSRELPESNQQLTAATVDPLRDFMVGDARASLWLVLGAVALILFIACANVAGLLLARAGERRGELAVRMSLGADRGRVIRQLLAESAVLGVLGGALGLALAWVGTKLVVSLGGTLIPRSAEIGFDAGAFLFAAALTLGATALFGVLPALQAADDRVGAVLAMGGRGSTPGASTGRRRALVGAEVAVSVVLLVGAALLVRSFNALRAVDPGFDPEGVATMTFTIAQENYPERADYMQFYRTILDRVDALPGVAAVGSIRRLPFRGGGESVGFDIPGVFEPTAEEAPSVELVHVGGRLFEALGVPVLQGRVFTPEDNGDAPFRVVVNEAFVRSYSPDEPLVGRPIRIGGQEVEVIGIVGDVRQAGLAEPTEPTLYVHQEQNLRIGMGIVARVEPGGDPLRIVGAMRNVVTELDADQPVSEVASMTSVMGESIARPRFLTLLLTAVAGLAALLASVGVYGVIATVVRQRTREVGIRMALGADRGDVVGLVIRQGMVPAALGLAAGIAVAVAASGVMESLLFQIAPLDIWAFTAAAALVASLGLVACGLPAVRASRLEPARVLREE
jgi:predicted permease